MNYLNVQREVICLPMMVDAPAAAVGTWLRVLSYGAFMECGGVLQGAAEWGERPWLLHCAVTLEEVKQAIACGLLVVEGSSVRLSHYPSEQEAKCRNNRAFAKLGGEKRAQNAKNASGDTTSERLENATGTHEANASTERKGKERKEREGKERGHALEASASLLPAAPCTEDEAWAFAKSQPVTPSWTRQMVGHWFSDREFRRWHTSGDNPTPIDASNWRADLRRSHRWAQQSAPGGSASTASGTAFSGKKNSAPAPDDDQLPVEHPVGAGEPDGWRAAYVRFYHMEPPAWRSLNDDIQRELIRAARRKPSAVTDTESAA